MSLKSPAIDIETADAGLKDNAERGFCRRGHTISKWHWLVTLVLTTALFVKYSTVLPTYFPQNSSPYSPSNEPICPQVQSKTPVKHANLHAQLRELHSSEEFKLQVAESLSGAIKLRTISHDEMGPIGKDPRWKPFRRFHEYLRDEFPLIHDELDLTKINTYGLVYHWEGKNPSLKPLLLAAHQDVVPVEPSTIDQWIHGSFSGFYDGKYIWGRGTIDDKGVLISIMSSIETLLDSGFQPERSIVLAFGFDEEAGGNLGAGHISEYLLENYGENGFALAIDEGGSTMIAYGSAVVTPSTSEKGYLNVGIEVNARGGHSSQPPDHTSIGLLSKLLVAIEENPFEPQLLRNQAAYETIQCLVHTAGIPSSLKSDILESQTSDEALARVQKTILADLPAMKYLIQTTQAIDLVQGGVKVNALPEQATAVVNHRIDTASSLDAVKTHIHSVLKPVAEKYSLELSFFENTTSSAGSGSVVVFDAFKGGYEPAPTTPTGNAKPWSLLSSTIRAMFEQEIANSEFDQSRLVIAPGISSVNTDTRYYWRLTPHIFRYSPFYRPDAVYSIDGLHSVNEAVSAVALTDQVRFFTLLILNADESREL